MGASVTSTRRKTASAITSSSKSNILVYQFLAGFVFPRCCYKNSSAYDVGGLVWYGFFEFNFCFSTEQSYPLATLRYQCHGPGYCLSQSNKFFFGCKKSKYHCKLSFFTARCFQYYKHRKTVFKIACRFFPGCRSGRIFGKRTRARGIL